MDKYSSFENIVGGKLKEFKKDELDTNDNDGFIVTKNNKEFFLGFTDSQEVYVKELVVEKK